MVVMVTWVALVVSRRGACGGGAWRSVCGVDLRPGVCRVDAGRGVDLPGCGVLVRGRLLAGLALLGLAGVRGAGTGLVRSVEAAGPLLGVRLVVVGTSPRLGRRVETRMRFAEVERPGLAGLGADAVRSGVGTGQAVQS